MLSAVLQGVAAPATPTTTTSSATHILRKTFGAGVWAMSDPSKLLDKSLKIKDKTELRKHLQVCLFALALFHADRSTCCDATQCGR
jgi:hypothetical protein